MKIVQPDRLSAHKSSHVSRAWRAVRCPVLCAGCVTRLQVTLTLQARRVVGASAGSHPPRCSPQAKGCTHLLDC